MKRSICFLAGMLISLGTPTMSLPAAQPSSGFADAGKYCRAVGNVDRPDARYAGPKVPRWMMGALGAGASQAAQVDWRCMGGRVFACFDGGASQHCSKADTSRVPTPAMYEECRANPGAPMIPMAVTGSATIYVWACRGRAPIILRQFQRVDVRGYPEGLYADVTGLGPSTATKLDNNR